MTPCCSTATQRDFHTVSGSLGAAPARRARWGDLAPPLRNRWFADSPLEGNGFEISVPRWLATANSVGAFISVGEWRLVEPPKQLFRFAEADDRSGDSAASTIDRPQPDRSLETAAYLARN